MTTGVRSGRGRRKGTPVRGDERAPLGWSERTKLNHRSLWGARRALGGPLSGPAWAWALALSLGLAATACAPAIGDECGSNVDCGSGRICDLSQSGGYCTVSPCVNRTCPDDSVCIEFDNGDSYCMLACGGDGDCRGGYECVKGYGVHPFCNAVEEQSAAPGTVR
jgi:hypothetical protein